MATINFLYRSTKDKADLNLRLLFRLNDKDNVLGAKTKLEVSKEYWSKQHNQKRPKDISIANKQSEISQELLKIENHVLSAFNSEDALNVSKEWLNLQMDLYYNPKAKDTAIPKSLVEYIDFYITYRKHELKDNSIKRCNVIKNKLMRFQEYRNKLIVIKEVNDKFKNDFVDYLKAENYAQNTIQRDIVFIKTFCKHARFLGLETHPQLDTLKVDKQKVPKTYLSFSELALIEKANSLPNHLDNARDWLIISCYTGQRVSDFMRFTKEMIRVEDGKQLIEFTQRKTGKLMTVPLHEKVTEILDKRNGEFPRSISDQKYNDYIKDLCKEAELFNKVHGSKLVEIGEDSGKFRKEFKDYEKWELVSSHIGRRSFATNFYGKIPTTYLIYITGHSTETQFLQYIGKSNKDLAMEISKYF